MTKIKIVFMDMDGTLLNGHSKISHYSKKIIKDLHSQGIIFGIATGRPTSTIARMMRHNGLADCITLVVGMNGSHILNTQTGYFEEILAMPAETLKKLFGIFDDGIAQRMLCDEHNVYMESKSLTARIISRSDHLKLKVTDFSEELKHDWPKAGLYTTNPAVLPKIVERFQKELPDSEIIGKCASKFSLEFTHRSTDKGIGIHYLAGQLHIPMEAIMGFGDSENDLGMLEAIGYPVAMKNASECVKNIAKDVTAKTNINDGVMDYLNTHRQLLDLKSE